MTTKPIAVWAVLDSAGNIFWCSVRPAPGDSIEAFEKANYLVWLSAERDGYRCKRFILSEAEGES